MYLSIGTSINYLSDNHYDKEKNGGEGWGREGKGRERKRE